MGTLYQVITFDYREDGVTVLRNGESIGEMWMTTRGCCYDHRAKELRLSADELAVIVNEMRIIEGDAEHDEEQ